MTVTRLQHIPGIGVDRVGASADQLLSADVLRLENLDTDIAPPSIALAATRRAVDDDDANSYLPFQGHDVLRQAVTAHVARTAGDRYDWRTDAVITAGGLNGITNVLLALLEPGDEVVMAAPAYAGLINRVRLASGVPRFAPMEPGPDGWRLDVSALESAVTARTRALLMMSPSMPTGAVMTAQDWQRVGDLAVEHDAWIIVDAAMERLRFDGRPPSSPASLSDQIADRVITVGSASKELRLIGWRVGWIVGPSRIMADIHTVGLTNVVCQVGIAQQAVADALSATDAQADIDAVTSELRRRHDTLIDQLVGLPVVPANGGWSVLLDCEPLGLKAGDLSDSLLVPGGIAATPMEGWGPGAERFLRLVFANEPVDRLITARARLDRSL